VRRLLTTIVLPIIFSAGVCSSTSAATYVFRHGQSTDYIFEQTLHILKHYNFFILYSNPEEGEIETPFK